MARSWIFCIHKKERVRICPLNLRYRPSQDDTSAAVEFGRNGVMSQGGARDYAENRSEQEREGPHFHRRYLYSRD